GRRGDALELAAAHLVERLQIVAEDAAEVPLELHRAVGRRQKIARRRLGLDGEDAALRRDRGDADARLVRRRRYRDDREEGGERDLDGDDAGLRWRLQVSSAGRNGIVASPRSQRQRRCALTPCVTRA